MKHRSTVPATGFMTLLLALAFTLWTHGASALDCVGLPYGYPGCPTRPTQSLSSSSGPNACGNAILDPGEECDKGRFNGKTDCGLDCRFLFCGDGAISKDIGEECEPETREVYVNDKSGNLTTQVIFTGNPQCGWYCQPPLCTAAGKCSGGCSLTYVEQCTESGTKITASSSAAPPLPPVPTVAQCGNGVMEGAEECDDGNRDSSDACSNSCTFARCGDAVKQTGEECDAGSKNSDTQQNACRTDCSVSHCGDSVTDANEQCDLGDRNSDSTANACRTNCRLASCSDGATDTGEVCDDGNRNDTDVCTNDCKFGSCGDGIVQAAEECDWGSRNSDTAPNACRRSCKLPYCGDNVTDSAERCDGGVDCSALCTLGATTEVGSSSSANTPVSTVGSPSSLVSGGMAVASAIGVLSTLVLFAAYYQRQRIAKLFRPKKGLSVDDVPLDQIEMPWHKW
ncbi:DUF4215 domain-containing protein [Candidatus Peribacteria bacterium]|nr:DUF4215 domain-containing protein [Candidatus Peribacteria bacterium]